MRKFTVGLMVFVVASAITCDAANAGRQGFSQGFFRPPVVSHQPFFFHKPSFFPFFFPSFFHKPPFGNRRFSNFSFPVIFDPYYPFDYAPYYPSYPSYDYQGGYAPTRSVQQAPEPAAPAPAAPAPEPAAPQVWYYCNPATGFHPGVQSCSAGWYQVSTTPPPPNAPQP